MMIPLTVGLCRRASHPTITRPVGTKKLDRFEMSDSSTPPMGKQSQIIIFRAVSGRPDLGTA